MDIFFTMTNLAWEVVLFIMWTSVAESVKVNRANEGLETVPRNMDVRVTDLILDNNNLVTLNSISFDIYVHLTRLSLKNCETTYILDGTFDYQDNLVFIRLDECNIIQLPLSFGPSTTKIKQFNIFDGANSADIFRYPYFAAFTRLTRLVIGSLKLDPFNASIVPLTVERLRLDYSKLYAFPDFRRHSKLNILTVIGNIISRIPQRHMDTLSALTQFRASENNLQGIPSFSHMKQLYFLEINDNKISSIPRDHIDGLQSLKHFCVSNNRVQIMPNISYLSKLELADFSNNLIQYVQGSCLYGLPAIQSLYLNGNIIIHMDDNSVPTGNLYLHDNRLASPPDLYDMVSTSLTLRGNPFVCNRILCWIRMWPFNKTLPLLDEFYCASPSSLNGSLVMDVHPTVLGCYKGEC